MFEVSRQDKSGKDHTKIQQKLYLSHSALSGIYIYIYLPYFWLHCVLISVHWLFLVVVLGLCIVGASLVAEHRL